MEGLGQQGGCQTIHDDLYVRVLALAHDEVEVVIIGCDLLFFERSTVERFINAIGMQTGLTPAQIFLNTSHTHAGPHLTNWHYGGAPDLDYLNAIEQAMVSATVAAIERREPVTLEAGMAHTDLPVSRRKPDANGRAQWAPYRAAEVCHALPFCLFKTEAGQVLSLLFSVSCHPSMIYSLDISADYPGAAMRQLNSYFQTEGALFLQGAGGDTKPRQIAEEEAYWRPATWEEVEAAGAEVANAVIACSTAALSPVTPKLSICKTTMSWPFEATPTREELAALIADCQAPRDRRQWAEEMLYRLDANGSLPTAVDVGLHLLQLGPELRLVGIEGELVGEFGNRILHTFASGVTFPLGYTDGAQIYLPTSRMLPEGGYEVDSYWEYHHPAKLAPGMEEILDAALREALTDEKAVLTWKDILTANIIDC